MIVGDVLICMFTCTCTLMCMYTHEHLYGAPGGGGCPSGGMTTPFATSVTSRDMYERKAGNCHVEVVN